MQTYDNHGGNKQSPTMKMVGDINIATICLKFLFSPQKYILKLKSRFYTKHKRYKN